MSFVCDHCGYTYSDDEINYFDGQDLCDECYEEETVVCEHCGERIWSEDAADCGRTLCQSCYDDCYTRLTAFKPMSMKAKFSKGHLGLKRL